MPDNVCWQTASTGMLGLNNTGDTLFLRDIDGILIDWVQYGAEVSDNQSQVRLNEGDIGAEFVSHSIVSSDGALFSPGTSSIADTEGAAAVPEFPALIYFSIGAGIQAFFFRKKRMGWMCS